VTIILGSLSSVCGPQIAKGDRTTDVRPSVCCKSEVTPYLPMGHILR